MEPFKVDASVREGSFGGGREERRELYPNDHDEMRDKRGIVGGEGAGDLDLCCRTRDKMCGVPPNRRVEHFRRDRFSGTQQEDELTCKLTG